MMVWIKSRRRRCEGTDVTFCVIACQDGAEEQLWIVARSVLLHARMVDVDEGAAAIVS